MPGSKCLLAGIHGNVSAEYHQVGCEELLRIRRIGLPSGVETAQRNHKL